MYAGQVIEYTIQPLLNIPPYRMTEITYVEDKKYFSDEQRVGPYSMWHHVKKIAGGIEMTDMVHYENPFRILGK